MDLPPPSTPPSPSSAIFVLCSFDTRVAVCGANLYLAGHGAYLIFSGNVGVLTQGRFTKSEAETFADIARGLGVPDEAIIVEPRATNTGENVRFTAALLKERGLDKTITSFLLVQKPYMERRTYATFVKQWPQPDDDGADPVSFRVTSPEIEWKDYLDAENTRDLVTNAMVGDLIRIREYPARGFQIPQQIPQERNPVFAHPDVVVRCDPLSVAVLRLPGPATWCSPIPIRKYRSRVSDPFLPAFFYLAFAYLQLPDPDPLIYASESTSHAAPSTHSLSIDIAANQSSAAMSSPTAPITDDSMATLEPQTMAAEVEMTIGWAELSEEMQTGTRTGAYKGNALRSWLQLPPELIRCVYRP
uniref:DUF218 domain-containing protein n=1 Tax=Mycena chlorophos TaxID=658473 RepID=A0ABQ0LRT9_MYCCL|nr:predicted protein [Mycena chlorophos]